MLLAETDELDILLRNLCSFGDHLILFRLDARSVDRHIPVGR
jgi:hypothetical protein